MCVWGRKISVKRYYIRCYIYGITLLSTCLSRKNFNSGVFLLLLPLHPAGISSLYIIARQTFVFFASTFLMFLPSVSILTLSSFLPLCCHAPISRTFTHALSSSHPVFHPSHTSCIFFFCYFFLVPFILKDIFWSVFLLGNLDIHLDHSFAFKIFVSLTSGELFLHILAAPLFAPCLDDHSRP